MNENKPFDFIVVGQGICGSIMAMKLLETDHNFLVVDPYEPVTSSRLAAGIVNPVTGKNFVKTWMADMFLPVAYQFYRDIESRYGIQLVNKKLIYRGLDNVEAENKWLSRTGDPDYKAYCEEFNDFEEFDSYIKPAYSYGVVKGGFQVNLKAFLDLTRSVIESKGLILKSFFDHSQLKVSEGLFEYQSYSAKNIIFCEGYRGESNPFFKSLPFAPSKGEVLFIRIPGARFKNLIKHKIFIAHLYEDIYWAGGGYEWRAQDDSPSENQRAKFENLLDDMLKFPYEVIDHAAAIRPATKNRRPLVIRHPDIEGMYFLNGMGTKGTSMAPYFTSKLIKHIISGEPLEIIS